MKFYLVGGAVRDQLMGYKSTDNDYVVVGATPEEMLHLGFKQVGADFPVFLDEIGNQYALARQERKTGQGYLGFTTKTGPEITLEDDLLRRDLTINAIAQDAEGNIVDPYNGRKDLENKVLRHVSEAFKEDPLRVIRLARFYARWWDFDIAQETIAMATDMVHGGELEHLPDERYWAEIEKMFSQSVTPERFFEALYRFGVLDKVKFFYDLLGPTTIHDIKKACAAVKRFPDAFYKLMMFVALAENGAECSSRAIPLRVGKLVQNMHFLQEMHANSAEVLGLLNSNRVWTSGNNSIGDVFRAMECGCSVGMYFPIEAQQLYSAMVAAQRVTSESFLGLRGPEIGKAMNEARLSKIRGVLGV